jgi:outer membrane protein TolC
MRLHPVVAALTFLLVSFQPGPLAVEPRSVTRVFTGDLTLDRAVEIALRQNADILKAIQEIERTRGQVIEVRAAALPHLTLSGNYNQRDRALLESGGGGGSSSGRGNNRGSAGQTSTNNGNGTNGGTTDGGTTNGGTTSDNGTGTTQGGGTTQNGSDNAVTQDFSSTSFSGGGSGGGNDKSYRIALEVRQALYTGGQVRAALNIARLTQDNSYYLLRDTIDQVIARVRQQFYTVLLNRALITVQEESVFLLNDQLTDQRNRFEAGTVPRFNVLRAEVELSNARPELIRARNNYIISQIQLAKTLALEAGPNGRPTFQVVGKANLSTRPFSLQGAIAIAKERRPFLKVQRQNILIEKEQIKIALAGYKPRLDANAGYEVVNSRLSDKLDDIVNGWFFGVTGSWDIFDGGETYGRTVQARARLESARVNYSDSVQQVELEVQQAFANLQQARETIQSQQKGVEQAQEALRLSKERLTAGAGTQLEVLDARVALTRARTTELQARADYSVALAEFDRVTATDTVYDDTFKDPLARSRKLRPMPVLKEEPEKKRPAGFKASADLRER